MFCPSCGHRNPRGSSFCSSCGAALIEESPEATIAVVLADVGEESGGMELRGSQAGTEPERRDQPILAVRRGPNAGTGYLLDQEVTRVGRHPDSDVFLDDITVSRRHAEVRRQGNGVFIIQDAGSLNGTYVNRERVDEAVLEHGDEVQIGKFRLVYTAPMGDDVGGGSGAGDIGQGAGGGAGGGGAGRSTAGGAG